MIFRARAIPSLFLVLSASAAVTVACGDDKGTGEEHSDTEPQVCKDISGVCHDADSGSGMAHDCHEQAHAGDAAVCEMISDECIAFCTGGTGTETGTMTTMTSTTVGESGSESSTEDEGTTHAHDESTSGGDHDESTGADHGTGSETSAATSCDILGSGCHDNKTPEGMECHDLGHDDDIAACDAALAECTEICGL